MLAALLSSLLLAVPVMAGPTYDLRPLAEVRPEFAPLQQALKTGHRADAKRLAVSLASQSTLTDVRRAAWYVLNHRCLSDGRAQCGQMPEALRADQDQLSAPFSQSLLHSRARSAIRAKNYTRAWSILAAGSDALRETNRLLLSLAERSLQRPWSEDFAERLESMGHSLSRRDRCRLMLVLGDKSSDGAGKWSAYRQVWRGSCGSLRRDALERLITMGMTPSPIERIDWLAASRLPRGRRARRKAERQILREIERVATGVSGLATYGRGVFYARIRARRDKAEKLLNQAITLARDADVLASAQYRSGDLLGKLNRDDEAIARLEPLLQMQSTALFAAKVRWRLFRLYRAKNRWLDAEKTLNELVNGTSKWRPLALWQLAWRRFRLKDYAEALRLLDKMRVSVAADQDDGKQPWHARIDYWRARCHGLLAHKDEAKRLYAAIVARYPQTYYGLIAHDRLAVHAPRQVTSKSLAAKNNNVEQPLQLSGLRVEKHPLLDGPVLLLRLGLLRRARAMLRGIVPGKLPRDGVHLLAALYHESGNPRAAYSVLRRHARRAAAPDRTTASVWRIAYRTPYTEHFAKAADQAMIPRSLLYAVARHESHFVATAKSPAGAVGLVQLLPIVANRIAGLYGLKRPSRRSLRRPARNLSLGAYYLAQINSFMRGNHALALAAYNAGPYAVRRWLKRTGHVPTDVFVESIPYRQARNYARGVLATAYAYARLHGEWAEMGEMAAGRRPFVPVELGPFMQPPPSKATASANLSKRMLAAPREGR